MDIRKVEPDETYIELAEQCHELLEQISDIFSEQLLNVEDDLSWDRVEVISDFKRRLQQVLKSPVKIQTTQNTD